MPKNEKVRIELRFDATNDKDILDFIDENGSTRAGFIKQVLKIYKKQLEGDSSTAPDKTDYSNTDSNQKEDDNNNKRKKPRNLGNSFSSKDVL